MPFITFFQASEEGKSDFDNDLKISWVTYCSKTILDSAKETKLNFWD